MPAVRAEDGSVSFVERSDNQALLQLPCGRCVGCRVDRARSWAVRVMHEAQMHESKCFVTLTYDPDCLPPNGSLRYSDYQSFMRRLRKRVRSPVRFYMCGEYGEKLLRPHYHACLFGVEFGDRTPYRRGPETLYRSALLESLWPHGFSSVGDLTMESAEYVARYCVQKVVGSWAVAHYERLSPDGEFVRLVPEFNRMSLKPGIGAKWFEAFADTDLYTHDRVFLGDREFPVPRYYDKLLALRPGFEVDEVKFDRFAKVDETSRFHSSPNRLAVREQVVEAGLRSKSRSLK